MGPVRYSRALVTATSSLALFGLVIVSLSTGMVREPWDLMILVPSLYVCPVAGVFVAPALFAGGLWTIAHLH
jgi:hypothetical protein